MIASCERARFISVHGFSVHANLLTACAIDALADALPATGEREALRSRGGLRNLLSIDAVRALAYRPSVLELVESALGIGAFPVRGLLFDKTANANWLVPWHQDLTIRVRKRKDVPGYGPWSSKAGLDHVQPPAAILERMLAVRIHLDLCDETTGALRVLPGTHLRGRMSAVDIAQAVATIEARTCSIPSGGAMVLKPLLLHSSLPSAKPSHRRVLHLEYANCDLEGGLEWMCRPREA